MDFKVKLKFGGYKEFSTGGYLGRIIETKSNNLYRIEEHNKEEKYYIMRKIPSGVLYDNIHYAENEIRDFIEAGIWKFFNE